MRGVIGDRNAAIDCRRRGEAHPAIVVGVAANVDRRIEVLTRVFMRPAE